VKDKILDLVEVQHCSADGIYTSIKKIFDNNIPYRKMIAFGADGPSTMMGSHNGVQTKLKQIVPEIYVQKYLSFPSPMRFCCSKEASQCCGAIRSRHSFIFFS
jgi:hypothetical protein